MHPVTAQSTQLDNIQGLQLQDRVEQDQDIKKYQLSELLNDPVYDSQNGSPLLRTNRQIEAEKCHQTGATTSNVKIAN